MTLLALVAIIFFGFATYNLTCAFVDIPTKKTSRMMMLARKQQGIKAEKLLDVYTTKIDLPADSARRGRGRLLPLHPYRTARQKSIRKRPPQRQCCGGRCFM